MTAAGLALGLAFGPTFGLAFAFGLFFGSVEPDQRQALARREVGIQRW